MGFDNLSRLLQGAVMKASNDTGRRRTVLFLGAEAAYTWNFRNALLRRFQDAGARVIVVAPSGGFDTEIFRRAGIEFIDWHVKRAAFGILGDLVRLPALYKIIVEHNPDVVIAHTIKPVIYGMLLSWVAKVPRRVAMIPGLGFAFIHGTGIKRALAALIARAGYKVSLGKASLVILQNADDEATLLGRGCLPRSTPTAIVNGSGVDMTRFSCRPLPALPFTFLMVARLLYDKGVREFMEAARIVAAQRSDARFVLVGSLDDNPASVSQELLERWRTEGVVEQRGYLADPAPSYAACHVYVLPSYREGTPRTSLEAMATGRAIITTDVPGCRETVEHGVNGLLVPARDSVALAAAMLALQNDLPRVREMGAMSAQLCRERFELTAVTEATYSLIEGAGEPSFGDTSVPVQL